ncbi:MFS transporter [Kribbella sp. CA-293567]|uniref:MFS transporter n=1 Tax=Kribbella sp. CA-293567 TaxID=3002436 RepID=UPI0022DDEB3D|nr:MFS transporter [Kribbella sp. CA-293567]WBQ03536.1 MFS transporter [Kribbella sp. CA-293567]
MSAQLEPNLVAGDPRSNRSLVVGALAVTQTVGYGVLYYVFGVFLGPMSSDLRISTATSAGALTFAILVSCVMSVPVGRWLDRRGAQLLMTTGSLLGSVAVLGWSQVQNVVQLYAVFGLIGVASAMVLYGPAIAVLVAVLEPKRRATALLVVTMVAGLASTIFIPLAGQLIRAHGWRHALLILGLLHNLVTVPLHGLALRHTRPAPARSGDDRVQRGRAIRAAFRDGGFWLITVGFVLHSGAIAIVSVHLVLFLVDLGYQPAVAAGLTGLLGVYSVTGRIVTSVLQRWLDMSTIAARTFLIQCFAIGVLPLLGRHPLGAAVCILLFGLGFGVSTLATPAILLERYGAAGYGTISGALATPVLAARAIGPLGAALLAGTAGYRFTMIPVALACVVAGLCLTFSRYIPKPA